MWRLLEFNDGTSSKNASSNRQILRQINCLFNYNRKTSTHFNQSHSFERVDVKPIIRGNWTAQSWLTYSFQADKSKIEYIRTCAQLFLQHWNNLWTWSHFLMFTELIHDIKCQDSPFTNNLQSYSNLATENSHWKMLLAKSLCFYYVFKQKTEGKRH